MSDETERQDPAPRRRSTLLDVARLAGLSHQTVSRYFRDEGRGLKVASKQRIEHAVAELDYHPNLLARSMRTRRTGRLAIVLPGDLGILPGVILSGFAEAAHEHGFAVEMVSVEGGAQERLDRIRELVDWGQVEGILSIAPLVGASEISNTVPIVVGADYDDDMHALGHLADGDTAADIIQYLASIGHRDFLHVTGDLRWASARNRRRVYLETIERLGLTSHGVVEGDWSSQSGFEAIMALPEDTDVTAVFAASDHVAMGVVRGAWTRGWPVPGRLSVWGWDDQEISRYAIPAISTVTVDRELQARHSMLRLIAAVRGEPEPANAPRREIVNRLVDRESTGPGPFGANYS